MSDTEVGILKPIQVIYCGKCGMPPEYCEYGPDFESHCNPWLKKNHPELHAKLKELRGDSVVASDATKEQETAVAARPTAPWTVEERLTAFYQEYQPDKVSDVPSLLEKYMGKEDKLFLALVKKYGPEPEDPYYAESDDDDDDEDDEELEEGMENLNVDSKKRRGVKAKQTKVVETRVVVQKERSKGKKKTTVVLGMDTVPNLKLKDVAKDFSKRFAGSSSVKEGPSGDKQIIIQGDHMEDVADMIVKKFKVPGSCVFLDFEGDLVAFS
jgi:density-regulated protein DRP1